MRELFRHQLQKFTTNFFKDSCDILEYYPETHGKYSKKRLNFEFSNSYDSENIFIENYGNPLCSVNKEYGLIVVNSNEEKVSIKIFKGLKRRKEGVSWFTQKKSFKFLTINKKTGDFYYGWNENYHKKKSKTRFTKNAHGWSPIFRIIQEVKVLISDLDKNYHPEKVIEDLFSVFFQDLNLNYDSNHKNNTLLEYYLQKKKIKYPNNFGLFYNDCDVKIPLKTIRKCDMKLVDAFMILYGFEGKVVKSAIHRTDKLNYKLLRHSFFLFDKSWLNSDEKLLIQILDFDKMGGIFDRENFHLEKMSKPEKKRVFELFKQHVLSQKIDLYSFWDHITMYNSLKDYGEIELKWKSQDDIQFKEEHLDWTDKLEFYKKGEYVRIYPQYMHKKISEKIVSEDKIYFPIILDKTKDYNDESNLQNNCVKTYIGRSSSIIISLRMNDKNSSERATIEYSLSKSKSNEIKVDRVQFLGKYNSRLTEDWVPVLLKLDERVLSCVSDKRFETVKIKKKCFNGVELFSDSNWNDEGRLRWTYKNIE
jgi:hypothetical protein